MCNKVYRTRFDNQLETTKESIKSQTSKRIEKEKDIISNEYY